MALPIISHSNTCSTSAPANDVDPLTRQFAGDVLDPVASQANAGPDAIDPLVAAGDRDFRSISRFATDRSNLDHPFGDLWYLLLKQSLHQLGLGA
jgi:hypothetical protein